jgi:hypothetical protein
MEGTEMNSGLKSALLAFTLITIAVGVTACAKYPVVADRATSPSPEASIRTTR